MKETIDLSADEVLIRGFIDKYGFLPEHKFEYFKYDEDYGKPMFVYNDDFGYLCFDSNEGQKKVIFGLAEPLTTPEKRVESIKEFVIYCLDERKVDKVVLETRHETKQKLKEVLKGTPYTVKKDRYYLMWPIFSMKNFDENLTGGTWKKLRYFKNKFFKDYQVEVDNAHPDDKEALQNLVREWAKTRTATDRAHFKGYLALIERGFPGFDTVKVLRINKKPVSLFGGWRIPNSKNYYSCLGIYDYSYENIGEVSNVIDLAMIKAAGYEEADFGGGEEALTNFKMKFHPDRLYRTDIYAVVKKE